MNQITAVEPDDRDDPISRMKDKVLTRLRDEAHRRVQRRHQVEQRWLVDLAQYHGFYDEKTKREISKVKGSTAFVNLTRPKTNAMTARLVDLLFPTDDKNWGIGPTPVPELTADAAKAAEAALGAESALEEAIQQGEEAQKANDEQGMQAAEMKAQEAEAQITEAQQALGTLDAQLKEARDRADLMEAEIDDHLRASNYAAACRDVIEDGCKIGCGVLKGPIIADRAKGHWQPTEQGFQLSYRDDIQPAFRRVDPWGFFPDPDLRDVADNEEIFERHLMTRKDLRKLARRSDVDKAAVRRLMEAGPQSSEMPTYLATLNAITEQDQSTAVDKWVVWEYTGALDPEEAAVLATMTGDEAFASELEEGPDPLVEINVRVLFSGSEVLSFGEHPLDSGDQLYSVFALEKDEVGPFGFGLPYLMRDDQAAYNAAWRMMMDNAGLATGPQIIVRKSKVVPANGEWKMEPRKIWHQVEDMTGQNQRPFDTFNVDMHQTELANIIAIARQQVDDVTGMPAIAQGEQGTNVTKTAQGMALLMNSANVVFRRHVKNFDDDVTVPAIRRIYHFLMQFSPKESIKGDYEVDARGSSVLLVRELQSQNLALIVSNFAGHPVFGPMLREYDAFREFVRSLSVPAGQIMTTEQEWKQNKAKAEDPAMAAAKMQQAAAKEDRALKREQIEADIARAEMENESRERIAELQYETAMVKLAETLNMTMEQLDAKLQEQRENRASSERKMAVEAAMKRETGDSSGGAI